MEEIRQSSSITVQDSCQSLSQLSSVGSCQTVPQQVQDKAKSPPEVNPYEGFVIIDRKYDKCKLPSLLTLMDSASFSGFQFDFYLNMTQTKYKHEYSLLLNGITSNFPPAFGVNKMAAQEKAAELALQILSRYCYTIKFNKEQDGILITEILDDEEHSSSNSTGTLIAGMSSNSPFRHPSSSSYPTNDTPLYPSSRDKIPCRTHMASSNSMNISSASSHSEDSYGSKMLKMMGWAGGGLGKDGSGIKEPIKSAQVLGRYGLGHKKRKECEDLPDDGFSDKKKGSPDGGFSDKEKGSPDGSFSDKEKGSSKNENFMSKKLIDDNEKKKPTPQVQNPVSLYKITDSRFTNGVHAIISHFVEDTEDQELVFSRKLSGIQRKIIHDIAEIYSLSSFSFGHHSRRHLVLFRNRCTPYNFLHNQSPTKNYEIIPPSKDPPVTTLVNSK